MSESRKGQTMTSEMPKTSNHVIDATTDVGQLRARVAELEAEVERREDMLRDALTNNDRVGAARDAAEARLAAVQEIIADRKSFIMGGPAMMLSLLCRALLPAPPKGG